MKYLSLSICFLMLILFCDQSKTTCVQASPIPQIEEARLNKMITQLGSDEFSIRNNAEQQLIEIPGTQLLNIITKYNGDDLEVKFRLERIYEKLITKHAQWMIKEFEKGVEKPGGDIMPYWKECQDMFPETKNLRISYLTMIKENTELFIKKNSTDNIDKRLAVVFNEALASMNYSQETQLKNSSTLRTLLFLSLASNNIDPFQGDIISHLISNRMEIKKGNNELNYEDPFYLSLVNLWLTKATHVPTVNRYYIGTTYKLPAATEVCRKIIEGNGELYQAHDAMCYLIKTENHKVIPELVGLLSDERVLEKRHTQIAKNKTAVIEIQVRDVALACLIKCTEQNPNDYEMPHLKFDPQTYVQRGTTGFENLQARDKAHAKWNLWAKANLTEKNELIKKTK